MSRRTPRFGTRAAAWIGLVVAFAPAGAQSEPSDTNAAEPIASVPGPASVAPPPPADAPQIEHFEYWQARGEAARRVVDETRAHLDEVNGQVTRMRRRNYPTGEPRRKLQEEQARAQAAWEAAVHHFEVELPALAREAGAPTRWLRAGS